MGLNWVHTPSSCIFILGIDLTLIYPVACTATGIMGLVSVKPYKVLIHNETWNKAKSYLEELMEGKAKAGSYLQEKVDKRKISALSVKEFLEILFRTKKPQIFAESQVHGDGSDWNKTELSILGDISVATRVTVYDNGRHREPEIHEKPFEATLLYTPGALLRNGRGNTPADWDEVTSDGVIDFDSYYGLYERRLLPSLIYADRAAKSHNKQAFITIPGLGCGQFAGKFEGQLGEKLKEVLLKLLKEHGQQFPNIKALYYDPYQECRNERHEVGNISFLVRPLQKGNENKPQLCKPSEYEEPGDDFSDCLFFSFVAWDHVSWPGNDFYTGSRATDDGVKSAATSSMAEITGIEGHYDPMTNTYDPPEQYRNWKNVVEKEGIKLHANENLVVLPE